MFLYRVNKNETIFEGSLKSNTTFRFGNFCQCEHMLVSGARCNCGDALRRQTCDLNLGTIGYFNDFYF